MAGGNFPQAGTLLLIAAACTVQIAALLEAAAIRRLDGGRNFALQQDALLILVQLVLRDSGQQCLGVRMQGIPEQLLCRCLFHDLT